tara:strand:+ start:1001 stop:1579 length:579 start_codon:yes stop_codon:yes gene_type:complete
MSLVNKASGGGGGGFQYSPGLIYPSYENRNVAAAPSTSNIDSQTQMVQPFVPRADVTLDGWAFDSGVASATSTANGLFAIYDSDLNKVAEGDLGPSPTLILGVNSFDLNASVSLTANALYFLNIYQNGTFMRGSSVEQYSAVDVPYPPDWPFPANTASLFNSGVIASMPATLGLDDFTRDNNFPWIGLRIAT